MQRGGVVLDVAEDVAALTLHALANATGAPVAGVDIELPAHGRTVARDLKFALAGHWVTAEESERSACDVDARSPGLQPTR